MHWSNRFYNSETDIGISLAALNFQNTVLRFYIILHQTEMSEGGIKYGKSLQILIVKQCETCHRILKHFMRVSTETNIHTNLHIMHFNTGQNVPGDTSAIFPEFQDREKRFSSHQHEDRTPNYAAARSCKKNLWICTFDHFTLPDSQEDRKYAVQNAYILLSYGKVK
jgi:hypothetical protein